LQLDTSTKVSVAASMASAATSLIPVMGGMISAVAKGVKTASELVQKVEMKVCARKIYRLAVD
jgi:hypothetical protein